MKFLPDTNVLCEPMKPDPDPGVMAWLRQHADDCALSVLVLGELASGVEALPDGKRKAELEKRLRFLQEDYADRGLEVDAAVVWEWARYRKSIAPGRQQVAVVDSLIAATALAWGLTLVTRNTADFPGVPQCNPFQS